MYSSTSCARNTGEGIRGFVMPKKLFPPYLNVGSEGLAVVVYGVWLTEWLGAEGTPEVESILGRFKNEGTYDDVFVEATKCVQRRCNVKDDSDSDERKPDAECIDEDGNLGPETRAAILHDFGMDFDALPFFTETTAVIPDDGGVTTWTLESATEVEPPADDEDGDGTDDDDTAEGDEPEGSDDDEPDDHAST